MFLAFTPLKTKWVQDALHRHAFYPLTTFRSQFLLAKPDAEVSLYFDLENDSVD